MDVAYRFGAETHCVGEHWIDEYWPPPDVTGESDANRAGSPKAARKATAVAIASLLVAAGWPVRICRRRAELEVMDPEDWIRAQVAAGKPEYIVSFLLGMYQAAHEGFFAGVDPLIATLLGREPKTVTDLLTSPTVH